MKKKLIGILIVSLVLSMIFALGCNTSGSGSSDISGTTSAGGASVDDSSIGGSAGGDSVGGGEIQDEELSLAFGKFNGNYRYKFEYLDTTELYDHDGTFFVDGDALKSERQYDGKTYYDYYTKNDSKDLFYYNDESGSYVTIDSSDDLFEYYVMYITFITPENLKAENFKKIANGMYFCDDPALASARAAELLVDGLEGEYESVSSISVSLEGGYVNGITIKTSANDQTYGDYEAVYKFTFSLYEQVSIELPDVSDKPISEGEIAAVYAAATGSSVSFEGVVVGIVGNNFYVSDYYNGVYVYAGKTQANVSVGDYVSVSGEKDIYSGLTEVKNITVTVKDSDYPTDPEVLTSLSQMEDYLSMNVSINNLSIGESNWTGAQNVDVSYSLSDGKNTSTLFISKYLSSDKRAEWYNVLKNLDNGESINITDAVVSMHNSYQIALTESSVLSCKPSVLTGIQADSANITVYVGTSFDEVLNKISVSKIYENAVVAATKDELTVTCDNYDGNTKGDYTFNIVLSTFNTTVTVTVAEKPAANYKLDLTNKTPLATEAKEKELTRGMPSKGNSKALVIPVDFTDYPAKTDMVSNLEKAFFGTSADTGWESLSSYYSKASYGKLNISGTVTSVYQTGKKSTYYSNAYKSNESIDYEIISAALKHFDSSLNYADYDSDKDGYIDALYLVYTAPVDYEGDSDLWWAYTYEYFTEEVEPYDGVEADFYTFLGYDFLFETPACGKKLTLNTETIIHESGHILGITDYYDYDDSNGVSGGIGGGDMMDANVGDFNAFSKMLLGWVNPYIVTESCSLELASFGESGDCVVIPKNWNGSIFTEFFVIDYYTPDGLNAFEKGYSGLFSTQGVRVYHVDATLKTLTEIYNDGGSIWDVYKCDNSLTSHQLIALVQASGSNGIINNCDYGSNSDLYTIGSTVSGLKWYSKTSAGFSVKTAALSNGKISLDITF